MRLTIETDELRLEAVLVPHGAVRDAEEALTEEQFTHMATLTQYLGWWLARRHGLTELGLDESCTWEEFGDWAALETSEGKSQRPTE